jgi:hypothetical protein
MNSHISSTITAPTDPQVAKSELDLPGVGEHLDQHRHRFAMLPLQGDDVPFPHDLAPELQRLHPRQAAVLRPAPLTCAP